MTSPKVAAMMVITGMFMLGMLAYALRWLWIAMIAVALLLQAYAAAKADDELVDPTPQEYADIQRWISSTCCWTKVKPSALTPLGDDEWRVEATGQIRKRTGWSQDGNTWRCTCDFMGSPGRWVVHPKANTRCIFPVANGS